MAQINEPKILLSIFYCCNEETQYVLLNINREFRNLFLPLLTLNKKTLRTIVERNLLCYSLAIKNQINIFSKISFFSILEIGSLEMIDIFCKKYDFKDRFFNKTTMCNIINKRPEILKVLQNYFKCREFWFLTKKHNIDTKYRTYKISTCKDIETMLFYITHNIEFDFEFDETIKENPFYKYYFNIKNYDGLSADNILYLFKFCCFRRSKKDIEFLKSHLPNDYIMKYLFKFDKELFYEWYENNKYYDYSSIKAKNSKHVKRMSGEDVSFYLIKLFRKRDKDSLQFLIDNCSYIDSECVMQQCNDLFELEFFIPLLIKYNKINLKYIYYHDENDNNRLKEHPLIHTILDFPIKRKDRENFIEFVLDYYKYAHKLNCCVSMRVIREGRGVSKEFLLKHKNTLDGFFDGCKKKKQDHIVGSSSLKVDLIKDKPLFSSKIDHLKELNDYLGA